MTARRLSWARIGGFALALGVGVIGGAIFNHFQMPLAWMLGAMTACTIAAVVGLPIVALDEIRPFMIAIIGVLLGAGFSPDLLGGLLGWLPSLLGLLVFIVISALAGTAYFRTFAKFDLPTAFFSAMPGGFIEMILLGGEKGGDVKLIALVHSARVLLVVFSLPYVLIFLFGVDVNAMRVTGGVSIMETHYLTDLWLLACAVLGMALGRLLKLPAKDLLGPMLLSGTVHMTGISDFQPASELVIAAQLFLGTSVGCRFAGMSPRLLLKVIALSFGSVAILMLLAVAFSFVLSWLSPFSAETLLLAYSPGGLTETSLIALSMGLEVAFVASHHIARVLIVIVVAAYTFAMVSKR